MLPTKKSGFTLIEILVTISILAILGTISVSVFGTFQKSNRDQGRLRDLNTVKQALELYRSNSGSYPASLSYLQPVYMATIPDDPIAPRHYRYQASPVSYIICAKSEGSGSYNPPSGCSSLNCETTNDCNMGVESD